MRIWLLFFSKGQKVKFSHTRYRVLGPELIPVYRQSACRWLWAIHPVIGCHSQACGYLTSRRASPPINQYQIILLGWQRHMGVNNLPKVVTRPGLANLRPLSHQSDASATRLSSTWVIFGIGYLRVLEYMRQPQWLSEVKFTSCLQYV